MAKADIELTFSSITTAVHLNSLHLVGFKAVIDIVNV